MYEEWRCAQRHSFIATAEVEGSGDARSASVADLGAFGCYLKMPDPFSKGASVLLKIRTNTEFFQSWARVAHSTFGIGMGVEFDDVSRPFQIVLQRWLFEAQQEIAQHFKVGRLN
jgi:hypothetical protein